MADYELIQERLISGKGVLKIPGDKKKLRHYILYSDVIRLPKNAYLNKNWNPDKGKYAFICFTRNDYVIAEIPIEYRRQSIDGIADISGQTLLAVKCAYEGTLLTLSNLGLALGAPPISYQDLIKDYENLNLVWDEIRVNCYADTALQLRLYRRVYDVCDIQKDDQPPPPPPPPPLPPVPPETPIGDISPPYDPNDADDGNTIPNPIDDVVPATCPLQPGYMCLIGVNLDSGFTGSPSPLVFQFRRKILRAGFGTSLLPNDSTFPVNSQVPRCIEHYAEDCRTKIITQVGSFVRQASVRVSISKVGEGSPQC